jgi:hypothetical protein
MRTRKCKWQASKDKAHERRENNLLSHNEVLERSVPNASFPGFYLYKDVKRCNYLNLSIR